MADDDSRFGSIIWIVFTLLAISSLIYLGIWSYHNDSVKGIAIVTIYSLMILSSLVLTQLEPFRQKISFTAASLYFTIGFWGYGLLIWVADFFKSGAYSFISIGESSLFATISGELPLFWKTALDTVLVPVSEELFWLFGLPITMMYILDIIAEKYEIMDHPWFRVGIIAVVAGISFALFHTAKIFLGFIFAASMYRIIMTVIYWGDREADLFKGVAIASTIVLGAHIGHNVFDLGFIGSVSVLATGVFGWLIMLFMGVIFIVSIDKLILLAIAAVKGEG